MAQDAFFVEEWQLQEVGCCYEDLEVAEILVSELCVSFVVDLDLHVAWVWGNGDGLKLLVPSADTILTGFGCCFEFALAVVVVNYAVDISESVEEGLIGLQKLQVEHTDLELDAFVERIDDIEMLWL